METGNNLAEASVVHVPDTQFNSSNAQNYCLLLDVAPQRYAIALFNKVEHTLTSVISKGYDESASPAAELEREPLLRHRYHKVVLSVPSGAGCFIADALFDERELNTYYNFNFSATPAGRLFYDSITEAAVKYI